MNRLFAIVLTLMFVPYAEAAGAADDGANGEVRAFNGREVYVRSCAICHANGVGGAPRFGHAEDWARRGNSGIAELLVSVLRGKGGMPPKGGNASLSREEAYAALDYMLNAFR
jgi:cytochrome c5